MNDLESTTTLTKTPDSLTVFPDLLCLGNPHFKKAARKLVSTFKSENLLRTKYQNSGCMPLSH